MSEYPGGYMKMANAIKKYEYTNYMNSFKPTRDWIKDELPQDTTILDYGCGNGSLGGTGNLFHGQKILHVTGFDDFDKDNSKAQYHNIADINRKFEYILSSNLIEHYQPAQVRELLKWYYDHCTNGLYIIIPNSTNPFLNFWCDSTHVRPYDIPELYYWLEQAGFGVVKVVRSGLPNIRWYSLIARLFFGKLLSYSPFDDLLLLFF